jgi:hypothetical protein
VLQPSPCCSIDKGVDGLLLLSTTLAATAAAAALIPQPNKLSRLLLLSWFPLLLL